MGPYRDEIVTDLPNRMTIQEVTEPYLKRPPVRGADVLYSRDRS